MDRFLTSLALTALLSLAACGDKDDDTGAAGAADAAGECTALCTDAGYSGGTADEYEHELNCFCEGSGTNILAEDCTAMCEDLGWSQGEAFDANACQCS